MSSCAAVIKRRENPGEITVDNDKIEEAVKFVNKHADSPSRSMLAIGDYLLKLFYNDDVSLFNMKSPRKNVSLRKLAEHSELNVSFMTLSNSMRLAVQDRLFTDSRYEFLSATHKVLLLGLPDDETRVKYADIAVEKQLTVRRFKDLLIFKSFIKPRGRKPDELTAETRQVDPERAFFKPLDRLARVELDFSQLDPTIVTEKRIVMLRVLRERIDEILKQINE